VGGIAEADWNCYTRSHLSSQDQREELRSVEWYSWWSFDRQSVTPSLQRLEFETNNLFGAYVARTSGLV